MCLNEPSSKLPVRFHEVKGTNVALKLTCISKSLFFGLLCNCVVSFKGPMTTKSLTALQIFQFVILRNEGNYNSFSSIYYSISAR